MTAVPGTVYLVGAGPGDPGLMTARSLELIATADAILYDRLIPPTALDGARADAQLEYVGKGPSGESFKQDQIEQRIVELAREGKSVVRLKGGDPLVFGRGGEEAAAVRAAGFEFEIVPGVTAGVAAAAYAGIPVTFRTDASAVAFVTGHEDPDKPDTAIDWPALASFPGTLVFYMGVRQLDRIASQLIEAGRPAGQPAAVIQRGTTPLQRTVSGPLGEIAKAVADAGIEPPALTVVGPVAARRDELSWFERRPLLGKHVAVTRARAQAGTLATKLRALGAEVIELPAIKIVPRPVKGEIEQRLDEIGDYDLLCLTSINAVDCLFDGLAELGRDARALTGVDVAAIGKATAEALAKHGVRADIVPERAIAESLIAELESIGRIENERVLVAAAAGARPVLPDRLREMGAVVDELVVYDTVIEELDEEATERLAKADFITFASGSAAKSLFASIESPGSLPLDSKVVSIGPVTSESLRELGVEPDAEAQEHDMDGLIAALQTLI